MENEKMDKKAIKNRVLEHIKSGKNYSQTKEMLEKEGIKYPALKNSFYVWREQIFPSQKVDKGLQAAGEKRREREEKAGKTKKRIEWTSAKQKKADDSALAELINTGVFVIIPCPTKELKPEHVQEINIGGAVVASAQYYFPDFNLDHPLVVLMVRGLVLVIKVKSLCYTIRQKIAAATEAGKERLTGIKSDWKKGTEDEK